MKFPKNFKFLFVARGPGETGQARALAKYISKKGGKILFCLLQKVNLPFLENDKEFKIFLTPTPQDLAKVLKKEKAEFLFLFNSKTWGGEFLKRPPFLKPKFTFCFDSNWLFNSKKYPSYDFVKWADRYFILFPKKIFELGLKEKGGNFEIEKEIKEKILPVGFIPFYKPISAKKKEKIRRILGINRGEKFVFSYFSGWGAGHRVWALENMAKAIDILVKKGREIKAIYLGPTENLNLEKIKRDWLILKERVPAQHFFSILASSDLVFMHQGMVTLAQAIESNIPVICNASILKKEMPKLHFFEVLPFKKFGACEMFSKTTKVEKIAKRVEELLYNKREREKMIQKQKEILENGEKRAFEMIKKIFFNQ